MKKYKDLGIGLLGLILLYACAFAQSQSIKTDCKNIHAQMEEHGAQKYSDIFKGQRLKDIRRACE